jgi:electron transfer flavoprotein alpha subunit
MGADKAVLIEDEDFYGADPVFVAKVLAKAVEPLNADMVFFGQRAVDDDCGLAASSFAEFLGMPQVSLVTKVEIDGDTIKVQRPIEGQTNCCRGQAAGVHHRPEGPERAPLRLPARHHEGQEKAPGDQDSGRPGRGAG